jgi:cysteine desulfurase
VAALLAQDHLGRDVERLAAKRDRLEQGLMRVIPRAKVNGDTAHRLPNTTSMSFEFIEGEAILLRINELGIGASSGSACTSGSLEPSHVLRAMGIPFTMVHGSIRFSLSRYTTDREIDYVIDVFPRIVEELRAISPYWSEEMVDGSMSSYPLGQGPAKE